MATKIIPNQNKIYARPQQFSDINDSSSIPVKTIDKSLAGYQKRLMQMLMGLFDQAFVLVTEQKKDSTIFYQTATQIDKADAKNKLAQIIEAADNAKKRLAQSTNLTAEERRNLSLTISAKDSEETKKLVKLLETQEKLCEKLNENKQRLYKYKNELPILVADMLAPFYWKFDPATPKFFGQWGKEESEIVHYYHCPQHGMPKCINDHNKIRYQYEILDREFATF